MKILSGKAWRLLNQGAEELKALIEYLNKENKSLQNRIDRLIDSGADLLEENKKLRKKIGEMIQLTLVREKQPSCAVPEIFCVQLDVDMAWIYQADMTLEKVLAETVEQAVHIVYQKGYPEYKAKVEEREAIAQRLKNLTPPKNEGERLKITVGINPKAAFNWKGKMEPCAYVSKEIQLVACKYANGQLAWRVTE